MYRECHLGKEETLRYPCSRSIRLWNGGERVGLCHAMDTPALHIDNWRWQNVPFHLRTGKRLPAHVSEISIQFRPMPHQSFPPSAVQDRQPNRLIIRIQLDEGITQRFQAKQPGPTLHLRPVQMNFSYRETFKAGPPEAYETLLLDVMRGDPTLFMRADQVDAAWSVLTPMLNVWDTVPPIDFPSYPGGTWVPEAAAALVGPGGGTWLTPILSEQTQEEEESELLCGSVLVPGSLRRVAAGLIVQMEDKQVYGGHVMEPRIDYYRVHMAKWKLCTG
jgi:hypothetical protein